MTCLRIEFNSQSKLSRPPAPIAAWLSQTVPSKPMRFRTRDLHEVVLYEGWCVSGSPKIRVTFISGSPTGSKPSLRSSWTRIVFYYKWHTVSSLQAPPLGVLFLPLTLVGLCFTIPSSRMANDRSSLPYLPPQAEDQVRSESQETNEHGHHRPKSAQPGSQRSRVPHSNLSLVTRLCPRPSTLAVALLTYYLTRQNFRQPSSLITKITRWLAIWISIINWRVSSL